MRESGRNAGELEVGESYLIAVAKKPPLAASFKASRSRQHWLWKTSFFSLLFVPIFLITLFKDSSSR
jgi:hypothetical protein